MTNHYDRLTPDTPCVICEQFGGTECRIKGECIRKRLAELEDKIENGTLIDLEKGEE